MFALILFLVFPASLFVGCVVLWHVFRVFFPAKPKPPQYMTSSLTPHWSSK